MRPRSAPTTCQRSISSASPPAVGKMRTGWPKWPQRTSVESRCMRSERQPVEIFGRSDMLVAPPELDALEEEVGEDGDLVRRKQRLDLLLHGVARHVGAEELQGDLVQMRQVRGAELLEALELHAL